MEICSFGYSKAICLSCAVAMISNLEFTLWIVHKKDGGLYFKEMLSVFGMMDRLAIICCRI